MLVNFSHREIESNPSSYHNTQIQCHFAGILLDVSGSGDDIDFNRSSGDNVSCTWKIDNFSSFCKQYSETFLIGDLRWYFLASPTIHMLNVCIL